MSKRTLDALTYLLTFAGLLLMLVGGAMWWKESRAEAALLAHEGRVLVAVTASDQPGTLPDFERDVAPTREPAPTPTETPWPTATPEPTATLPPATVTFLALTPSPTATATPPATPTPTPTPDPFPPAATVPSRIVAPAIGLDASVVEMGWVTRTDRNGNAYSEWVVPDFAAGWHKNAALPGHGGNTVLSGHHNIAGEVFRYVVNLEPGNEVALEADGHTYRYRVEEKYIVKEKGQPIEVRRENNRFIEPTPDERLTLVSCWPYETNTHRVVVIARPIIEIPMTPEELADELNIRE